MEGDFVIDIRLVEGTTCQLRQFGLLFGLLFDQTLARIVVLGRNAELLAAALARPLRVTRRYVRKILFIALPFASSSMSLSR